jgi:hypothetical protein
MSVTYIEETRQVETEKILRTLRSFHTILSGRYLIYRRKWNSVAAYRFHIFQAHQYVRHTVPILERLFPICPHGHQDWLASHIEEERGHDDLFANDLYLTGGYPCWKISPHVANYIDSSALLVASANPFSAVLADMLLAEGNAPSKQSVLNWAESTGISTTAFSGILVHANADAVHRDQIINILHSNEIDLEITSKRLVQVASHFISHWEWMIENGWLACPIIERYDTK